ncbi:MAG: hypothetical protein LBC51_07940 [Treponema sp.]|jgi:phosphotransferase system enzyme I (PtsI)|nr:hypothetical protein [Treponema sp.]
MWTPEPERFRGKPTRTKSGQPLKLFANIGSLTDGEAVLARDAEGIGVFRGEFLYLGQEDYPGEDIQYESCRKVVETMQGKRVDYFHLPGAENPALGMRRYPP